MPKIEYIYIDNEYTICTGIPNIENNIELNLKDLVFSKKALKILNLPTIMCDLINPDDTFERYCSYLAKFFIKESKERYEFYLTNPKVQILCSGKLLKKLTEVLQL